MGSTKVNRTLMKFFSGVFLLFAFFPLFAQNVSLTGEISRLEKLSSSPGVERYNAFLSLARLQQLSGNPEAALKAYEGALAAFPGDGLLLLEQGRLLISLGEYEKASVAVAALLARDQDREIVIQGRYLFAQLEAFRSGNTQILAALAKEADFAEYRSGIYYTLWKLTALSSWRTGLVAEFPQSPEAKIAAAAAGVDSAPTPLWLLFPGRDSIQLSAPPASTSAPVGSGGSDTLIETTVLQTSVLQTGLFGREENAKALAERLKNAGFEPIVSRRQVNGNDHWAVLVSGGRDMNATIQRLKTAGFDSFPVKN